MIISVYNIPQNKLIHEIGYSKIKPIYVNSQNFINSPLYYYLDDEITSKIKPIFNELHEKYDSSHGDFFRMEMNKHIIPLNERQIELIKEIIPEIEKNK